MSSDDQTPFVPAPPAGSPAPAPAQADYVLGYVQQVLSSSSAGDSTLDEETQIVTPPLATPRHVAPAPATPAPMPRVTTPAPMPRVTTPAPMPRVITPAPLMHGSLTPPSIPAYEATHIASIAELESPAARASHEATQLAPLPDVLAAPPAAGAAHEATQLAPVPDLFGAPPTEIELPPFEAAPSPPAAPYEATHVAAPAYPRGAPHDATQLAAQAYAGADPRAAIGGPSAAYTGLAPGAPGAGGPSAAYAAYPYVDPAHVVSLPFAPEPPRAEVSMAAIRSLLIAVALLAIGVAALLAIAD
ncbi:MAG: hypothetical protein ACTHU0_09300 [Kofleriaceae bacterium]